MVRHLLEKWMSHAMVYRVLHHTASEDYDTSNTFYKIPAIVITAISAGLAFSVQVFPEETSLYVPVLVGMLNLTAGVFTTITNFKKLPELSEANKIAAVNFSKLHRKIKQKLTLFTEEKIIFVLAVSLVSQMGDIIISYFKRLSKIKDTGNIIPGHGGILDRIDGMIFAYPFSYIIFLIWNF